MVRSLEKLSGSQGSLASAGAGGGGTVLPGSHVHNEFVPSAGFSNLVYPLGYHPMLKSIVAFPTTSADAKYLFEYRGNTASWLLDNAPVVDLPARQNFGNDQTEFVIGGNGQYSNSTTSYLFSADKIFRTRATSSSTSVTPLCSVYDEEGGHFYAVLNNNLHKFEVPVGRPAQQLTFVSSVNTNLSGNVRACWIDGEQICFYSSGGQLARFNKSDLSLHSVVLSGFGSSTDSIMQDDTYLVVGNNDWTTTRIIEKATGNYSNVVISDSYSTPSRGLTYCNGEFLYLATSSQSSFPPNAAGSVSAIRLGQRQAYYLLSSNFGSSFSNYTFSFHSPEPGAIHIPVAGLTSGNGVFRNTGLFQKLDERQSKSFSYASYNFYITAYTPGLIYSMSISNASSASISPTSSSQQVTVVVNPYSTPVGP